jgi:uncharacterized protein (UPF0276 family)
VFRPPRLGAGLVYNSFLDDFIVREPELVDFVEIEPETLWVQLTPGREHFRLAAADLDRLRALPCAKLLHSIGFPIGGSCPPDLQHVALLNQMADGLESPWVSEHLSFNVAMVNGEKTRAGMLLPPFQTEEGVEWAVKSIVLYSAALNRPLAVETGVNYLKRRDFEMSDGSFIRQVVERADCGILLDLHNLWANERNGRQTALDVIAELPLDRVWEVHVAGGEERNGYWIDGHCGTVPEPVRQLAREVIPCLPNLGAVTLEVFPAYLPGLVPQGLRREIDFARELCAVSKRAFARPASPPASHAHERGPRIADWEQALAEAILRREPTTAIGRALAEDPAVSLYSELLEEFRASMLGTALGLTTRLLLLHLGEEGTRALFSSFWRRVPPEMSAAAEALRFAEFVCEDPPAVALLVEILSFETAAVRALMEHVPQRVHLDCDIRMAIQDLVERRIPARPGPTPFEFVLEPPTTGGDHIVRGANLS